MIKLSIYKDKRIVIEDYNELKQIENNEIIVDGYSIKGEFLKIMKMDEYMLEITGIIEYISVLFS